MAKVKKPPIGAGVELRPDDRTDALNSLVKSDLPARLGRDLGFLGVIGTAAIVGLTHLQSPTLLFGAAALVLGLWALAKWKKWID